MIKYRVTFVYQADVEVEAESAIQALNKAERFKHKKPYLVSWHIDNINEHQV